MLYALLIILLCPFLQSEGFARSTLVKTPQGYQPIGTLQVNDDVVCYDIRTGKNYKRPITDIQKSKSKSYFIRFSSTFAIIGHDQLIYIPVFDAWIPIQKFLDPTYFSRQTLIRKILPFKTETLISLTVAEFHNFYVTEDDILVHNAPAIFVAEVAESLAPLIVSSGIFGTVASYLGFKAFKKSKKKSQQNNHIQKKEHPPILNHYPVSVCDLNNTNYVAVRIKTNQQNLTPCPKQSMPELINTCPPIDDEFKQNSSPCCIEAPLIETDYDGLEEECNDSILTMGEKLKPKGYKTPENPRSNPNKKKQGNPEERYKNNVKGKKLSAPEAREQAVKWGMKETKKYGFDSHGQPVFTDGKIYITPDVDAHSGGTWKVFGARGVDKDRRLGTFDENLNQIGT